MLLCTRVKRKTSTFQNHTVQNLRRQLHFKVHTGNLELKNLHFYVFTILNYGIRVELSSSEVKHNVKFLKFLKFIWGIAEF
jgi:hypothetical protein